MGICVPLKQLSVDRRIALIKSFKTVHFLKCERHLCLRIIWAVAVRIHVVPPSCRFRSTQVKNSVNLPRGKDFTAASFFYAPMWNRPTTLNDINENKVANHYTFHASASTSKVLAVPGHQLELVLARERPFMGHVYLQQLAAICAYTRAIDRSSRAGYRSILVLTSLANTCAGQSERRSPPAPIRTPEWSSRLSDQRRILFTQPRGTPEQERQLVISCLRMYFS